MAALVFSESYCVNRFITSDDLSYRLRLVRIESAQRSTSSVGNGGRSLNVSFSYIVGLVGALLLKSEFMS